MSYDLHIYATEALSSEELVRIVAQCDLAVDETEGGDGSLTVVRGARRRYSFTAGLADQLEPEDVPEEVTALILEPRVLYEVLVEGSAASEVTHARRFARRVAEASKGVVIDEQAGTVWSRGKLRTPPKVERGFVDLVEIYWWLTSRSDSAETARQWVELARRHLPELQPRRWGTYEPLTEKADPATADGFADYVAHAESTVYFKVSSPGIDGHAAALGGVRHLDCYGLSLHRTALHDLAWRQPLQRFFVDFASNAEAVLATAEVVRHIEWSGRSVGYDARSERPAYLSVREGWAGLPPYPVWWTWFGPDYRPLVEEHLSSEYVSHAGAGLFHWRSDKPADREQLGNPRPTMKLRDRLLGIVAGEPSARAAAPWLPAELLAIQPPTDAVHGTQPFLKPARVRPVNLS